MGGLSAAGVTFLLFLFKELGGDRVPCLWFHQKLDTSERIGLVTLTLYCMEVLFLSPLMEFDSYSVFC